MFTIKFFFTSVYCLDASVNVSTKKKVKPKFDMLLFCNLKSCICCNFSEKNDNLTSFSVLIQDNNQSSSDRWIGKINFVEIRSFWHIFRSFDRMWIFFILCLQVIVVYCQTLYQFSCFLFFFPIWFCSFNILFFHSKAMTVIAWNDGSPSAIFDAEVFKKVLSIFITAAIMKLGQGLCKQNFMLDI